MQTCTRLSFDNPAAEFYADVLTRLTAAELPFLIGGAFAFTRYTSIHRDTKDLDLFLRAEHLEPALQLMSAAGYRTELPFPHWLGKIHAGGYFVDLIFSSGNGVARVDDAWFERAVVDEVLGVPVGLCPPEEMIWSKAFIQERERFDGADVLHLFRSVGDSLDWRHLLDRFGEHWPVLFGHVVMYRYAYPDSWFRIPDGVVQELSARFAAANPGDAPSGVCRATLLSREQYLWDLEHLGYEDARVQPYGAMTPEQIDIWTKAIGEPDQH